MIILKSAHTIGPKFNVLDGTIEGLIEYCIEWADRLFEKNVTMVNQQSLILNWKIEK